MQSRYKSDYEIFIRYEEEKYSVYCPQINTLLKGEDKDSLLNTMNYNIKEYISKIPLSDNEQKLNNIIYKEQEQLKENIIESDSKEPLDKVVDEKLKKFNAEQDILEQVIEEKSTQDESPKNEEPEVLDLTDYDGLFFNTDVLI